MMSMHLRPEKARIRRWHLAVIAFFLMGLLVGGVLLSGSRLTEKQWTLPGVLVERGRISNSLLTTGVLLNKEEVSLVSPFAIEVLEVAIEEGQQVRRGELLARLDDREARLNLQRAKAGLRHLLQRQELAREQIERVRLVYQAGGESGKSVEDAELAWQSLRKDVELARLDQRQAQWQLDRCRITAPVDAYVVAVPSRPGAQLRIGDVLFRLSPLQGREIEARLDAGDSAAVVPGKTVLVTSEAFPGQVWPGKITWVAPATSRDGSLNQLAFRIGMDNVTAPLLLGQQVDVRLEVAARDNVLKLPAKAILSRDGKRYVVMAVQGRIRFREVTTGIEDIGDSEILSGLGEGEVVLLDQGKALHEGDAVKLLFTGAAR